MFLLGRVHCRREVVGFHTVVGEVVLREWCGILLETISNVLYE